MSISLLVSLPLLLIAGVLLGNLSNLLLLNERRKLGRLRLRGVSGRIIGATLLLAIAAGGLIGGTVGAILGTVVPLTIYFGGVPPLELIRKSSSRSSRPVPRRRHRHRARDRTAAGAQSLARLAARSLAPQSEGESLT